MADDVPTTVTAGAVTIMLVLPVQVVVGYVRPTESVWMKRIRTSAGTFLALLLIGIYAAAGVTMLESPGKDFRKSFDVPPYGTWWTAAALILVQWYA